MTATPPPIHLRPDPSATSFLKREDGVPSSQVQKLAFDRRGRLWMATPSGLASFDGSRVQTFTRQHGLRSHGVRDIAISPSGRLWLGTDAGFDVLGPDGIVEPRPEGDTWPFGYVQCLLCTEDTLWLGTAGGLVAHDGREFVKQDDEGVGGSIRALAQSGDGRVWVAVAGQGLCFQRHSRWVAQDTSGWHDLGDAVSLASGPGTHVFVGTQQGFVETSKSGRIHARQADARPGRTVRCMALVGDELWAAIGDELCVYQRIKGDWQRQRVVLAGPLVSHILPDGFGNVWAASESHGVVKVSVLGQAIRRLPLANEQAVFAVRGAGGGRLVVSGESATCYRNPDDPDDIELIPELDGRQVWDIVEEPDGSLLAATASGLVHLDAGRNLSVIGTDNPVLSLPTRCIARHEGRFYVGGIGGCVVLDDSLGVTTVPARDDEAIGYVYTLVSDSRGRLWAGTVGNGLWRLDNGEFRRFEHELLSPTGNTFAIDAHDDHLIVLAQENRIFVLSDDDELKLLTETEDTVAAWAIRFVPDGTIWAGSASGLVQYDARTGRQLKQVVALLGVSDWEFVTSRSLYIHHDGRFFCGVNAGLVEVDTARISDIPELPEVAVAKTQWERVEPELKKGQYVVPYRRWTLSVDVFTSWFIDESDVQFRFRLTGFDEDWRDLQPEAAIRLNTLPPGEYRLEAQAWSRLAGFGPATELLAFRVEKPRWLKRLVTSPISSFVEFRQISRAVDRNRALNRKNLELQQLVEERTADLEQAKARLEVVNLELASQSLTDPLTGIGNRRLFDEQLDAAVLEARRHGSPLSLLLIDVDHFKPYNDLYGHARGDEALVFVARQLLSTLFRPGDQAARYGGEEFAVLLPNADREGAMSVAERLRDAVEGLSIEHEGAPDTGNVTISIGVTTWNPLATTVAPGTGKLLVESADAALYDAKQAGRNRTAFRPLGVNS